MNLFILKGKTAWNEPLSVSLGLQLYSLFRDGPLD